MQNDWHLTRDQMPPPGEKVIVLNGDQEQALVYDRGLWWLPDRSMYVYFEPRVWRHPGVSGD